MADVLLIHHVQGLTDGVRALADRFREGGHTVHTPDLYDGRQAATIEDGLALLREVGSEVLQQRVDQALADLGDTTGLVYAGISWGAATAQELAQTRPGAGAALLFEACLPLDGEWGTGPWPDGVPVQVHGMDQDPFFALEGDLDAARALVETVGQGPAELFTYPGDRHLFLDSSLPSYDADATDLVVQRSRQLLDRLG